jgi:hypothetical protein
LVRESSKRRGRRKKGKRTGGEKELTETINPVQWFLNAPLCYWVNEQAAVPVLWMDGFVRARQADSSI